MAIKDHVSETPATALLKANKVVFTEHPYEYLEHSGAQLDEDLDAWGTKLSHEVLVAIDAIRWELRDPAL